MIGEKNSSAAAREVLLPSTWLKPLFFVCLSVIEKVPIAPPSRRPPATRERLKSLPGVQTKNAAGAGRAAARPY